MAAQIGWEATISRMWRRSSTNTDPPASYPDILPPTLSFDLALSPKMLPPNELRPHFPRKRWISGSSKRITREQRHDPNFCKNMQKSDLNIVKFRWFTSSY